MRGMRKRVTERERERAKYLIKGYKYTNRNMYNDLLNKLYSIFVYE